MGIWKWQSYFVLCLVVVLLGAGTATASTWAGLNGVVRLSFSEDEELTAIKTVEPDANGTVSVDLYAVLTDVEPLHYKDKEFAGLGGFELRLLIEGAEPIFVEELFSAQHFNVSQRKGSCQVGLAPGLKLENGRVTLVHWKLLFMEPPQQVAFRLDPNGLHSCETLPGCPDEEPDILYCGMADANLAGMMFGAVHTPAYLNWDGEPDLKELKGTSSWQDTGLFTEPSPQEEQEAPAEKQE